MFGVRATQLQVACLRPLRNGAKPGLKPTTYNHKSDALAITPPGHQTST